MDPKSVIEIKSVGFSYEEKPVLTDVSITVQEGDLLALVGPNGSGKTTLLKLLLGIFTPKKGTVLLYREPLESYPPKERAKKIAYVSQQPASSFPLTVFELVSLGRYPYSARFERQASDTAAVEEALAFTDSVHLKDRGFTTLSGGEKQKVLIARALAQSIGILLLDEPTVHLDLYYQLQILQNLKRLCLERRTTVIAVFHELNLVSLFADKVVMLCDGKKHAFGPVAEVLNEENIRAVFGVDMTARTDGETGARYFLPRDPLGSK
jgi:iron complex transport system ATP-binding protein